MNSTTKFFRQINKINVQIKKKIWVFQKNLLFSVFSLFFGFVFGNLFGTFLNYFRHFFNWDGLIITITIFIVEFINYLNYQKSKQKHFLSYFFVSKMNAGSHRFIFQSFFVWVFKNWNSFLLKQIHFFSMTQRKEKKGFMSHHQKFKINQKKKYRPPFRLKKKGGFICNINDKKRTNVPFFSTVKQNLPLINLRSKQTFLPLAFLRSKKAWGTEKIIGATQFTKTLSLVFFPVFLLFDFCSSSFKKIKTKQTKKTLGQNKAKTVTLHERCKAQKCFLSFPIKFIKQNQNKSLFFFPYFFIETREISKKFHKHTKIKLTIDFIKLLNFYKIGLLLGFFIDAFKVGS